MRRVLGCVAFSLLFSIASNALPTQFAYRISFTNKLGSASINNPTNFLSQKALDRRTKYNITVDSTDLPVSPDYLDSVISVSSGIIHVTSKWLNDCVVLVEDSSTMQSLRTKPFVKSVEWVGYFPSGLHDKPAFHEGDNIETIASHNQQISNKPTGNASYYGSSWNQTTLVNGDCLHDNGWMGEGMLIALFDNGFNWVNFGPAFDSLYTSGRIVDTFNFVKDTSFVYGYGSHGTEVLSILAGYIPNYFVGAAPLAQYALFVTEDATSEQPIELDNMIAGFERSDSLGADLMSMSLGYNTFDNPFPSITSSQLDGKTVNASIAANMAMSKGIMMVVTAGNEGSGGLLAPGDADSVLTIGNVDVNKIPATSSGYGPNASGTIKPNVCGLGNPGYAMTSTLTVTPVSGTSISTPSIAGFTACLMQANPMKNPYQIRNAIQETGHTYSNPGIQLGYGVPDYCAANLLLDVKDHAAKTITAQITPNPFTQDIFIQISLKKNQQIQLTLADISGRVLKTKAATLSAGSNNIMFDAPQGISSGVYLLKIQGEEDEMVFKLEKQ